MIKFLYDNSSLWLVLWVMVCIGGAVVSMFRKVPETVSCDDLASPDDLGADW